MRNRLSMEGKKMGKKLVWGILLFFIMSLSWSASGWAQIVPSTTESLIVVPVAVPKVPGSLFSVGINLVNARPIAGVSGRLVFDRNLIEPIIVDSLVDTTRDTTFYQYSIDRVGRGVVLQTSAGDAGPGAVGFLMFSLSPTDKINSGSGVICQINFRVKAALDTTICASLVDDPDPAGLKNGLSDTLGFTILPSLGPASVQIGAGSATGGCGPVQPPPGPGNDPPIINAIASQTVPQGSILSFSVTASDPDGDNVTLSATTLPQN
ncbi:MAG: cohesin domain-containing protein, partial [candidate division Zixibacteria bacterium]|nr:cohesin domain-containing protein [candidate division Zixibacteria bacterium]